VLQVFSDEDGGHPSATDLGLNLIAFRQTCAQLVQQRHGRERLEEAHKVQSFP